MLSPVIGLPKLTPYDTSLMNTENMLCVCWDRKSVSLLCSIRQKATQSGGKGWILVPDYLGSQLTWRACRALCVCFMSPSPLLRAHRSLYSTDVGIHPVLGIHRWQSTTFSSKCVLGPEALASPEACWKYRISGPIPDLLNQNLHFDKIPQ